MITPLLLALCLAAPSTVQAVPPDIAALQELIARQAAAVEGRDLDALGRMYAPDVIVFENGGENRGWPDYRDNHLGPELKELKDLRYKTKNAVVIVGADLAWATFDTEFRATVKGEEVSVKGKGTMIFKRTADGWRIAHEHTSGRREKRH